MIDPSTHVVLGSEKIGRIVPPAGAAYAQPTAWTAALFQTQVTIAIDALSRREIHFDIVGVDASIANALRRIMMAEVPTIAIETVYIWINTSLVQDEVLAQRLGLIPISCNPHDLHWKSPSDPGSNDQNTLVFKLSAKCERRPTALPAERDPEKLYTKPTILSGDLVFAAKGDQGERLTPSPKPVQNDILLAKLRPGQELVCEVHCQKGVGKDHAKWSPVATASYRLLPEIEILQPIPSEDCDAFAACFPPGVISVSASTDGKSKRAQVANPRLDTVSREVLRHSKFAEKVKLGRKRDHYIFSLESAGQYSAQSLTTEAIQLLKQKIAACKAAAQLLQRK